LKRKLGFELIASDSFAYAFIHFTTLPINSNRLKIAELWKQSGCPTKDKQIKKMQYSYTMEFYSATKKEILSFASKWMEQENISLSEVSQAQKEKSHMFSLICGI
jgi:hypothetical protein